MTVFKLMYIQILNLPAGWWPYRCSWVRFSRFLGGTNII